jgi:hypothetical protein
MLYKKPVCFLSICLLIMTVPRLSWAERQRRVGAEQIAIQQRYNDAVNKYQQAAVNLPNQQFTQSLSQIVPITPSYDYQTKSLKDFGVDASAIDETHLNDNAVLAVANTASTQAANMALPGVGLATRLVGTGIQFHDISNVANGQSDPHAIEGVVPSAVMGWDIIKGNKNLPTQTSITPINTNYNAGAFSAS